MALTRWYAVLRGRPTARMIRSSGTGSGWVARYFSTWSARVAAGTCPIPETLGPPGGAAPRYGGRTGPYARRTLWGRATARTTRKSPPDRVTNYHGTTVHRASHTPFAEVWAHVRNALAGDAQVRSRSSRTGTSGAASRGKIAAAANAAG